MKIDLVGAEGIAFHTVYLSRHFAPQQIRGADVAPGHSRPMHSVPVPINVRCYSDSDMIVRRSEVTLRATFGLMRRSKLVSYSINSSASNCIEKGTVSPSSFAVFILITNSNLVGCSTGISAGLVPRSILSTISPARRNRSEKLGP